MYVIRIRKNDEAPWQYFNHLEQGIVVVCNDIKYAMCFLEKSEGYTMLSLLSSCVISLDPYLSLQPLNTDEEDLVEPYSWLNSRYFDLD